MHKQFFSFWNWPVSLARELNGLLCWIGALLKTKGATLLQGKLYLLKIVAKCNRNGTNFKRNVKIPSFFSIWH